MKNSTPHELYYVIRSSIRKFNQIETFKNLKSLFKGAEKKKCYHDMYTHYNDV